MTATIVVENTNGADVLVPGCLFLFYVSLGNAEVDPEELLAWPACRTGVTIPAGTSTYPVTVAARYVACFGASQPPICVNGNQPPPLPPGKYKARLYQNPYVVRAPSPIVVRVTR